MYSMLIVEDERLPRMALRAMIQKNYPEFSSVWEAEDGEAALKIVREHRPDILLVDINLPGTTGLELCQALASEGLGSHTIITTAYGRFSYVKQAMDLGCQAYLLKPVGDKELDHALKKCFSSMEKSRYEAHTAEGLRAMQSYVSPYLMQEFREKGIQAPLLQSGYGWPKEGELSAYYLKWEGEIGKENLSQVLDIWEQTLKPVFNIIAEADGSCVRILLQGENTENTNQPIRVGLWMCTSIAAGRIAKKLGRKISFSFSGPHHSYETLNRVFLSETGMTAVNGGAEGCLDSGLFLKKSIGKKQKALLRQRIVQRFREGKPERAAAVLQRLEKENFEQMIQLLLEALWVFEPDLNLLSVWELLAQMESGVAGITRWLQKILGFMSGKKYEKRQRNAIDTALDFLELHYGEMVSEAQLAEEVGLSQAYFSRLFKQKTGENFSTVLLKIRLDHVRSLLEAGEKDSALIAERCGFTSVRYLDMVFKQACGMSMAQYRSQKEGNCENRNSIKKA